MCSGQPSNPNHSTITHHDEDCSWHRRGLLVSPDFEGRLGAYIPIVNDLNRPSPMYVCIVAFDDDLFAVRPIVIVVFDVYMRILPFDDDFFELSAVVGVVIPPDPNVMMLAVNNDRLVSGMMSWFDRCGVSKVVLALLNVNRRIDNQKWNICSLKRKETRSINRHR